MYSQFQSSYQRVEASLQKLTDSIAAYNPSVSAADALVAADDAVKQNLDQLVTHQQNHHRIQHLRATTDALDETIRTTLRLLADARKDIAAIPAFDAAAAAATTQVDVHELLSYAKFIAPTTVPPTHRPPLKDDSQQQSRPADTTANTTAQISNGLSTPQAEDAADSNPAFVRSDHLSTAKSTITEAKDLAWLVPNDDDFQPWPTQAIMNSGALGEIQRMVERGEDPALKLSKEEQANADKRREAEEDGRRRKRDEEERRAKEMFGAAAGQRRGTVVEAFNPDDL